MRSGERRVSDVFFHRLDRQRESQPEAFVVWRGGEAEQAVRFLETSHHTAGGDIRERRVVALQPRLDLRTCEWRPTAGEQEQHASVAVERVLAIEPQEIFETRVPPHRIEPADFLTRNTQRAV